MVRDYLGVLKGPVYQQEGKSLPKARGSTMCAGEGGGMCKAGTDQGGLRN